MKADFRAWDKENERMLYSNNEQNDYPFSWHLHSKGIEIMEYDGTDWHSLRDLVFMQYTGLKDKIGKKVCESDIVLVLYGKCFTDKDGLRRIGKVVYDSRTASFKIAIRNSAVLVGFYDVNKVEIIGNIYQSSNLLYVE